MPYWVYFIQVVYHNCFYKELVFSIIFIARGVLSQSAPGGNFVW